MQIKHSIFIKSSAEHQQCPAPDIPEFAFIGRSNVGKSSLINMLLGRKNLATVSSKPGKTRLINHFKINDAWYLVDLPGYGWARVSKETKSGWDRMLRDYLTKRKNLACVFSLVDSRIEPRKNDLEFLDWMGKNEVPFVILFTKSDKQSRNKTQANISAFIRKLENTWEVIPKSITTSAVDGAGRKEVLDFIADVLKELKN